MDFHACKIYIRSVSLLELRLGILLLHFCVMDGMTDSNV